MPAAAINSYLPEIHHADDSRLLLRVLPSFVKMLQVVVLMVMTGLGTVLHCFAQNTPDYEEIPIFLNVQRVGATEMQAQIREEKVYLPVTDLFNFLKIKYELSKSRDSVTGTFISPDSKYVIDKVSNRIIYRNKSYNLQPGSLIKTRSGLYLLSDYFGEIFDLQCVFSFRNLSVILSTQLELPVLREMRQEQMRTNLSRLSGEFKADTTIGRNRPLFSFGTADYSALTSAGNKGTPQDARLSLGLGGMIAGGETNVVLNYHNNEGFSRRQQYYLWRYVDNNMPFVKQILAGKIQGQWISSIYAPLIGVQVTNTPTTYRRSFGSYTLSNYTEPNWMVELYVNGVLINYVKADAAGFYTFNVPMVYGNTVVKLRFYGPYGEERSTEQNINIPFNFLPKGEFEYTASSGIVEDGTKTRFARVSTNYGLSRNITVGGGVEYLSSITSGTKIPFLNTSVRLLSNLLISGEYDHDVRSKAVLNYNLPSGLQVEVNNTWYKKGQTAINNTFIEDRKAMIAFPIRARLFSAYTRLTVEQIILENTRYTLSDWMVSVALANFNASTTTYAVFLKGADPYVYSNFSLSLRMLKNVLLTQQLQYEYMDQKVIGIKTELEKRVFKSGYLNLSYEKNFSSSISNLELGLRYDFSFAQTRASVRKSNDIVRSLQGISGSLIHDSKSGFTNFNNYTSVGKGAILLIPYLDLNGNNRKDADEPKAQGLNVRINGGRIQQSAKDTTIRITDLEAYTNYSIELDASGFDRLAWKLLKKNYNVVIDPNFVKHVEIPIAVFGEASGRVILNDGIEEKGQGNVLINFYNERNVLVGHTISEVDGYYSYLGLLPGKYTARMDAGQLKALDLTASSLSISFTVIRSIDGALVNHLDLVTKQISVPAVRVTELPAGSPETPLEKKISAEQKVPIEKETPVKLKTTVEKEIPQQKKAEIENKTPVEKTIPSESRPLENKKPEVVPDKRSEDQPIISVHGITIQAAHFKYPNALASVRTLSRYYKEVILVPTKGPYYNIWITGAKDVKEAKMIIKKISKIGYPKAYILK